jgi:hypothetical protein
MLVLPAIFLCNFVSFCDWLLILGFIGILESKNRGGIHISSNSF